MMNVSVKMMNVCQDDGGCKHELPRWLFGAATATDAAWRRSHGEHVLRGRELVIAITPQMWCRLASTSLAVVYQRVAMALLRREPVAGRAGAYDGVRKCARLYFTAEEHVENGCSP